MALHDEPLPPLEPPPFWPPVGGGKDEQSDVRSRRLAVVVRDGAKASADAARRRAQPAIVRLITLFIGGSTIVCGDCLDLE